MIEAKHYSDNFFLGHESGAYSSAKVILPLVNQVFHPRSVVDIGCGVGNWLKVWRDELGVADITGVEGPYISKDVLQIPKEQIVLQDLKQPLNLKRKFDLAMSLEVAEHLPESSADHFVDVLTGLSDVILFSASIPGQDGTYHINEQVPEYWAKKFIAKGYVAVDFIRDKVWNNEAVEWWLSAKHAIIY
jgi:SAM-dependent methyltransferase